MVVVQLGFMMLFILYPILMGVFLALACIYSTKIVITLSKTDLHGSRAIHVSTINLNMSAGLKSGLRQVKCPRGG